MSIEVELKVGMIDMSLAQLLTSDHRIIEFPSILLPDDVVSGSIVKLSCARSKAAETEDHAKFHSVQESIRSQFSSKPAVPVLRVHNFTQTSVVLEWDRIDTGSAELLSLALLKNGQHLGVIPNPDRRTSTKLSNLEIDKPYQFELVLSTTAGIFKSNLLDVRTQKMTDLSGLTVCVGSLEGSEIPLEDIERIIEHIGCRPLQHEVQLDTTHYICTEPDSDQYPRAQARNMPIVRPQWLRACEDERRLVEVRGYYLSEDRRLVPPNRPRAGSVATAATADCSVFEEATETEADKGSERVPSISVTQHEDGKDAERTTEIETESKDTDTETITEATQSNAPETEAGAQQVTEEAVSAPAEPKDSKDAKEAEVDTVPVTATETENSEPQDVKDVENVEETEEVAESSAIQEPEADAELASSKEPGALETEPSAPTDPSLSDDGVDLCESEPKPDPATKSTNSDSNTKELSENSGTVEPKETSTAESASSPKKTKKSKKRNKK